MASERKFEVLSGPFTREETIDIVLSISFHMPGKLSNSQQLQQIMQEINSVLIMHFVGGPQKIHCQKNNPIHIIFVLHLIIRVEFYSLLEGVPESSPRKDIGEDRFF